jgi:hypothetical protein
VTFAVVSIFCPTFFNLENFACVCLIFHDRSLPVLSCNAELVFALVLAFALAAERFALPALGRGTAKPSN